MAHYPKRCQPTLLRSENAFSLSRYFFFVFHSFPSRCAQGHFDPTDIFTATFLCDVLYFFQPTYSTRHYVLFGFTFQSYPFFSHMYASWGSFLNCLVETIHTSRWGKENTFWDCLDLPDCCSQGFTSPHTDGFELIGECSNRSLIPCWPSVCRSLRLLTHCVGESSPYRPVCAKSASDPLQAPGPWRTLFLTGWQVWMLMTPQTKLQSAVESLV